MAAKNLSGSFADGFDIFSELRVGFQKKALAAAEEIALTPESPFLNIFEADASGNDVLLPAETNAKCKGMLLAVKNSETTTGNLAVKEADDSTAVLTLAPNDGAIFYCDGVAWLPLARYDAA